ncbi:MAG TPA: tRNA (adenosine(37)-N6)-threonylcarbamoyltransferase complex dimerization subunit type 1 TsaB [Thermoanaerobaculia bacterium]|nr:tRNA (adenosine(37)-N6)-threonylcarbamoyltransferase complex dimerization subunit type 1 TsaB [Thermoanaerobaculia bacterium]
MIILGVDTSLPIFSVALLADGSLLGAVAMEGKGSRNEKLLPSVDWLLTENAIERARIDLFAVTRGPGSFTGVRIGLATIQGIALALGKSVCAMSTHEAVAFGSSGRIAVIDDAGRGELYASIFDDGNEAVAPFLMRERPSESTIVIGEFVQHDNVALRCARRADAIAQRGELAKYADITPIYVRLAEAEVKLALSKHE